MRICRFNDDRIGVIKNENMVVDVSDTVSARKAKGGSLYRQGGQLPFYRSLPFKRGFVNIFRVEYAEVNLDRLAEKYELPVYETPVGFNYIADYMLKEDILIGGEESGGISFRGHIPEGDGILMGLLLIEIVAKTNSSLHDLVEKLLQAVKPYLLIKREQASVMMDLVRHKQRTRQGRRGRNGRFFAALPDDVVAYRDGLCVRMKELNARGPPVLTPART